MADLDDRLNQLCADGKLSTADADEIRTFAAFLEDAGPHRNSPDFDPQRFREALLTHYPEEYAVALGEVTR